MNRITIFLSLSQFYRREEQLCIMCENLTSLRINEHSFIPLNDIIFYSAPAEETEDDVCLSIGDVHCPHPTHPLSSNQCCGRTVPGEFQVSHGDLEPTTLVTRNFTAQHPFYHSDLSPFSFLALFTPYTLTQYLITIKLLAGLTSFIIRFSLSRIVLLVPVSGTTTEYHGNFLICLCLFSVVSSSSYLPHWRIRAKMRG